MVRKLEDALVASVPAFSNVMKRFMVSETFGSLARVKNPCAEIDLSEVARKFAPRAPIIAGRKVDWVYLEEAFRADHPPQRLRSALSEVARNEDAFMARVRSQRQITQNERRLRYKIEDMKKDQETSDKIIRGQLERMRELGAEVSRLEAENEELKRRLADLEREAYPMAGTY